MLVLYAPTFRDDGGFEGYQLDFPKILETVQKKWNKECLMIVRLHPNVQSQSTLLQYNSKIINGTHFSDMQELSILCDLVITDYSTTFFDFVLQNKPVFICALDLEKYKMIRGVFDEFYSFPFPIAYTNEELIKNINIFDREDYEREVNAYFDKYPIYDTGNASAKTVHWLLDKIDEGNNSSMK